ncbi:MAG: DUF2188 domain-containing protein [Verrucomicrobiia bacterium]
MFERRIYHVLRRPDDSWQVLREGFRRPHIVSRSQAEAVLLAKRLARTGASARVVVYSKDNQVEREFLFTSSSPADELCFWEPSEWPK